MLFVVLKMYYVNRFWLNKETVVIPTVFRYISDRCCLLCYSMSNVGNVCDVVVMVMQTGNSSNGSLPILWFKHKKMHICNWKITRFLFYGESYTIIFRGESNLIVHWANSKGQWFFHRFFLENFYLKSLYILYLRFFFIFFSCVSLSLVCFLCLFLSLYFLCCL